jgi:hypothetical protein
MRSDHLHGHHANDDCGWSKGTGTTTAPVARKEREKTMKDIVGIMKKGHEAKKFLA